MCSFLRSCFLFVEMRCIFCICNVFGLMPKKINSFQRCCHCSPQIKFSITQTQTVTETEEYSSAVMLCGGQLSTASHITWNCRIFFCWELKSIPLLKARFFLRGKNKLRYCLQIQSDALCFTSYELLFGIVSLKCKLL